MSRKSLVYDPRNITQETLAHVMSTVASLEAYVVYGFVHKSKKKLYLHITNSGLYGMMRVYRQLVNREKLEPNLEEYDVMLVHIDDDGVRAKQMFFYAVDDFTDQGYEVMYQKNGGIRLRTVVTLETSAALGFELEDKGYAVVHVKANGVDKVVGVFEKYKEAKEFANANYKCEVPLGLVYADNELTKRYFSVNKKDTDECFGF